VDFLNEAHVEPEAHHKAAYILDLLEVIGWMGCRVLDVRDWFRKSHTRRQWGLGLLAATGALAFIGFTGLPHGRGPVVDGPKPPVANGVHFFTYTVESGDNTGSLAETYHTTVEQIVADNHALFVANTEWCKQRPVSKAYLEGRLPSGQKRSGEFCVLTTVGKEKLALGTLKVNNLLHMRCPTVANNIASCNQDAVAFSE
jgi:hypothetical protein